MGKNTLLTKPQSSAEVKDWMQSLREAMFNSITETDIAEMMAHLVTRAKGGDIKAMDMVFKWVVGQTKINIEQVNIHDEAARRRLIESEG